MKDHPARKNDPDVMKVPKNSRRSFDVIERDASCHESRTPIGSQLYGIFFDSINLGELQGHRIYTIESIYDRTVTIPPKRAVTFKRIGSRRTKTCERIGSRENNTLIQLPITQRTMHIFWK